MNLVQRVLAANDDSFKVNIEKTGLPDDLGGLVVKLFGIIGTIAGVVVFFYLIYSGFIYLTAGGNAEQAKKGQQGIINAAIGLIIIVLAYAIFQAFRGTAQKAI
ncbi:MAG TPA: hypothetical protein PK263_05265 [bacterium]|nr:hypothetical protein [bacterium]